MKVEVRVPEEFLGPVVGDLNSRRGEVSEVDSLGNLRIVRAIVPIAEMFAYSSALRGATQGRGQYSMELAEYRDVPGVDRDEGPRRRHLTSSGTPPRLTGARPIRALRRLGRAPGIECGPPADVTIGA